MSDVAADDFETMIEGLAPVIAEKLEVPLERAGDLAVSLVGALLIEPDNTVAVRDLEGTVVGFVPFAAIEPYL